MKKSIIVLLIIAVSGCAQSSYRDHYGYGAYGYADSGRYYGYSLDSHQDFDSWGGIGSGLNWNTFPDRYGIAYGAVIDGPYRYPQIGFYYRNGWYPSTWWGSYSAFDPWYSDYYYSHRYGGTYLSLNFNFYDFDGGWYTGWYDPWPGSWGYGLAYNWFQPFHGWRRYSWGHWSTPWYGDPHYRSRYSRDHRRHDGGWTGGPGYRPHYRGDDYYRHRYSGHTSARSEAAHLAARRSAQHSRDTYRRTGRVDGHERYRPHNNPRNVVTRQYKRPAERQRSTRSTHRYNRVPATRQPFYGQSRTAVQRRGHSEQPNTHRRYQHGSNRLENSHNPGLWYNPQHTATHGPSSRPATRHSTLPQGNRLVSPRTRTTGLPRTNAPVRTGLAPRQHARQKPAIRHINRYQPARTGSRHQIDRPRASAQRARHAPPAPQHHRQKKPAGAATNHPASRLNPGQTGNDGHSARPHLRGHANRH